jgi:hypothetical protein
VPHASWGLRVSAKATTGARDGASSLIQHGGDPFVAAASPEIPLRIVLVSPPPDETFCLQGKPGELIDLKVSRGEDLTFDFSIRMEGSLPNGRPRFLGSLVQGPPSARFVYICSGTLAGDSSSCWTRRAKVPLAESALH